MRLGRREGNAGDVQQVAGREPAHLLREVEDRVEDPAAVVAGRGDSAPAELDRAGDARRPGADDRDWVRHAGILPAGSATAPESGPIPRSCAGAACCRPCRACPGGSRAKSRRGPDRDVGLHGVAGSVDRQVRRRSPPKPRSLRPRSRATRRGNCPCVNEASIAPPDVSAWTRPPASTMRMPPPEVSASMSPVTLWSSIEPPEDCGVDGPVRLEPSMPPPEVSTRTRPLMSFRSIEPPDVSRRGRRSGRATLMLPPEVSSLACSRACRKS